MEFALVFPVLLLFLFGIIDFGVAYDRSLSLRSGVQQGARAAVVANFGAATPIGCVLTGGIPTTSPEGRVMCLTKSKIGLTPQANVRVGIFFVDANGSGTAAYEVGDYIRLCVTYPLTSASGVLGQFLRGTQKSNAEMRIEQVTAPALTPTQEAGMTPC